MFSVRGIYDGKQIKFLEPVSVEQSMEVMITFLDDEAPRRRRNKAVEKYYQRLSDATFDRITFNPKILGGKALIKGTRISVSLILNFLAAKMTPEEIIAEYPQLMPEDIQAALAYAAEVTDGEEVVLDKVATG